MASNRSHLYLNKFLWWQSRKSSRNVFPKMHFYSRDGIVVCCYICLISLYKLIFKHCSSFCIVEYSHTPPRRWKPILPRCPKLGFLHLARRGVFIKDPIEAWESRDFAMRKGVQDWSLFCQTDTSRQTLTVRSNLPVHLVEKKTM